MHKHYHPDFPELVEEVSEVVAVPMIVDAEFLILGGQPLLCNAQDYSNIITEQMPFNPTKTSSKNINIIKVHNKAIQGSVCHGPRLLCFLH